MGADQTIEENPYLIDGSTDPLIDHIKKNAERWYKKGRYVELPILCQYKFI
uniref:Uncharacterized protein n=1 Tax=viral metagenome TaxID=1070528 RepID=A0A6C0IWR2_9ZZZZ